MSIAPASTVRRWPTSCGACRARACCSAGARREDARAYAVKLTDEGRRVLRTAEPLAKKVDERILDALPGKQREQFVDDLLAIVDDAAEDVAAGLTPQLS